MTLTKEMVMGMKAERITKIKKFGDEEIECVYRKCRKPLTKEDLSKMTGTATDTFGFCPEFNPRTYIAEEGIICDQDVAVKLRDGTVIYTDIFRPQHATGKVPCIVSWSPFGKRPGDGMTMNMASAAESNGQVRPVVPVCPVRQSVDPAYGRVRFNVDPRGIAPASAAIMSSSALRTAATAMTSSNGSQPSTGAAKSASAATPASPWFTAHRC